MAFTPGTLALSVDTIAGGSLRIHFYTTADTIATVTATDYFTKAGKRGLRVGDIVIIYITSDPTSVSISRVTEVDAAGNATVSIDDAFANLILEYANNAAVEAATISVLTYVIKTQGYTTRLDGGGGYYIRSVSEPSHGGKIQAADGSWWELEELYPNLLQFGCLGDNSTNNLTALSRAETYGYAKTRTVWIPKGVFRTSGETVWRCSVKGQDNWHSQVVTTHATANIFKFSPAEGRTVENIHFDSTVTRTGGGAIVCDAGSGASSYQPIIKNNLIQNQYDGIVIVRAHVATITDNYIVDYKRYGINISNAQLPDNGDHHICGNIIDTTTNTAVGIYQTNAGGCRILSNKIGGGDIGVMLDFDGVASTSILMIADNSIENQNTSCIFTRRTSGSASFLHVMTSNNELAPALALSGAVKIGNAAFNNVTIIGNIIQLQASGSTQYGIYCEPATNISIDGNILKAQGAAATGMAFESGATGRVGRNTISGFNTVYTNNAAGIYIEPFQRTGAVAVTVTTALAPFYHGTQAVLFSTAFNATPKVVCNPLNDEGISARAENVSTAGFTVRAFGLTDDQVVNVDWVASGI